MVARKPATRTYDPDETRRLLLDAALTLFAEQGFSRTSMQDIADRAGVTKGAFYHHFATKEEALHIIHDEFIDRALASQEQAVATYASPTDQLSRMVYDITLVCITFQRHVQIFFRELHELQGAIRDAILLKRRRSARLFEQVVKDGIAAGQFEQGLNPTVAALGLLGMCVWTYQWHSPNGSRTPHEIARQFAVMALASVGVSAVGGPPSLPAAQLAGSSLPA